MDGGTLHSIGDLARRTGLSVKTIRFYSDQGLVEPAHRDRAGHRMYDDDAAARLELVRTLRDLGISLAVVRQLLSRELSLPDVAATHAQALEVHIRILQRRRAVLTAIAHRRPAPEEIDLMHELVRLSQDERRRLVAGFLDACFTDSGVATELPAVVRSMTPHLPDDPTSEQRRAWLELERMMQDDDFRALLRRLAEGHMADRPPGRTGPRRDVAAIVHEQVTRALDAGIAPTSPRADPIVAELATRYSLLAGRPDTTELRARLLSRLKTINDPRREEYLRLLAEINEWSAPETLTPAFDWSIQALASRVDAQSA